MTSRTNFLAAAKERAVRQVVSSSTLRLGRLAASAVIVLLAAMALHNAITNQRLNWPEQMQYMFSAPVLNAVKNTLWLTIVAMTGATALGILLAVMRLSDNRLLRAASWLYVWLFRGTPLYTQLLIWGNLGALFPKFGLGLPFGPEFVTVETTYLMNAASAAAVGLVVNEAAYMAEIVRGGIISIDLGQSDAAAALGMTQLSAMRNVILPQAMRIVIPPIGNETIAMMKNTSLATAIPYYELTFAAQNIYARTYQIIPMLIMACVWYLALSSVLMIGQHYLERHFVNSRRAVTSTRREPV